MEREPGFGLGPLLGRGPPLMMWPRVRVGPCHSQDSHTKRDRRTLRTYGLTVHGHE